MIVYVFFLRNHSSTKQPTDILRKYWIRLSSGLNLWNKQCFWREAGRRFWMQWRDKSQKKSSLLFFQLRSSRKYFMKTLSAYSWNVLAVPGFSRFTITAPSSMTAVTDGAWVSPETKFSRQWVRSDLVPWRSWPNLIITVCFAHQYMQATCWYLMCMPCPGYMTSFQIGVGSSRWSYVCINDGRCPSTIF